MRRRLTAVLGVLAVLCGRVSRQGSTFVVSAASAPENVDGPHASAVLSEVKAALAALHSTVPLEGNKGREACAKAAGKADSYFFCGDRSVHRISCFITHTHTHTYTHT